jgi:hypothetical protein
MLDEEVNKPKVNMDNINYLLKIYLHDTGILLRTQTDNKPIQIYGKTVPLKSYVETYLNILTSPTISYDEIDSPYISTIIKTNTNNIIFEEIDSQIPELFDELLTAVLKNQSEIYLKRLIDIYKINATKTAKRNKHLPPQKNLLSST